MEEEILEELFGGIFLLILIGLVVAVIILAVALSNKNKESTQFVDKTDVMNQLKQLHDLYKQKAISQKEYESLKKEILAD